MIRACVNETAVVIANQHLSQANAQMHKQTENQCLIHNKITGYTALLDSSVQLLQLSQSLACLSR